MAGRTSYYGNIVRDGLILDLDAGKTDSYPGSGTLWRDITWNNRNGTLINFGPSSFYSRDNGGYLIFDGTNDYVDLGSPFNLNDGVSKTFNVWFTISTTAGTRSIISDMAGSNNRGWWLAINTSGQFFFGGSNNGLDTNLIYRTTTNASLSLNTWYNLTLVYNQSTPSAFFYINGTLLTDNGNTIYSGYNNSSVNVQIGAYFGASALGPFNGRISQIFVYNKALTQSEVTQNYNALKGRFNL